MNRTYHGKCVYYLTHALSHKILMYVKVHTTSAVCMPMTPYTPPLAPAKKLKTAENPIQHATHSKIKKGRQTLGTGACKAYTCKRRNM